MSPLQITPSSSPPHPLPTSSTTLEKEKVKAAATSFTSFFFYRMFKTIHQGLWKKSLENPFSLENQGSQLFRDFLLMERSEQVVRQDGGNINQLLNTVIADVSRGTLTKDAHSETKTQAASSPAP